MAWSLKYGHIYIIIPFNFLIILTCFYLLNLILTLAILILSSILTHRVIKNISNSHHTLGQDLFNKLVQKQNITIQDPPLWQYPLTQILQSQHKIFMALQTTLNPLHLELHLNNGISTTYKRRRKLHRLWKGLMSGHIHQLEEWHSRWNFR